MRAQQLELFETSSETHRAVRVKLVSIGRALSVPTGFATRATPLHSDYATPDGRWIVEANWWQGGHWCVFDTADPAQHDEARERLARRYYERGIAYCERPIPTDTGVIVRSLDEARAVIAAKLSGGEC